MPFTGASIIVTKGKCLLQNVNKHLCLSASDSQTVLWCRYWRFDRSSTTHQHQAATLTTASSGCINGKVWRTVAKQTHASDITTHDGVLYQLYYCSSAFRKCWEQASNFVPALTALLSHHGVFLLQHIVAQVFVWVQETRKGVSHQSSAADLNHMGLESHWWHYPPASQQVHPQQTPVQQFQGNIEGVSYCIYLLK